MGAILTFDALNVFRSGPTFGYGGVPSRAHDKSPTNDGLSRLHFLDFSCVGTS